MSDHEDVRWPCHCRFYGCAGQLISKRTYKRHLLKEQSTKETKEEYNNTSNVVACEKETAEESDEIDINMDVDDDDMPGPTTDRDYDMSPPPIPEDEDPDNDRKVSDDEDSDDNWSITMDDIILEEEIFEELHPNTIDEQEEEFPKTSPPDARESALATEPLYNEATETLLTSLLKLLSWFTKHPSLSKSAFSESLAIQKAMLPADNLLPGSYEDAMRLICPYLVSTIKFDVCPKDHVIFRRQYKGLMSCPVCWENRYDSSGRSRKVFTYLPLGPRFARLYSDTNLSQLCQSHHGGSGDDMLDLHDSPAFLKEYLEDGYFKGDRRGISLAFNTDGVNPYDSIKIRYSMWPIMLTNLNLPRKVRNLFSNILLVGVVPGNKNEEPTTLDPYLDVVIDELLSLTGHQMYDAYQQAPFDFKVKLLLHILDYRGAEKVFHITGANATSGCIWCEIKGVYQKELSKVVYIENRRFLEKSDPLRQDTTFPEGKETRNPPQHKNYKRCHAYHAAYEEAKTKVQNKDAI